MRKINVHVQNLLTTSNPEVLEVDLHVPVSGAISNFRLCLCLFYFLHFSSPDFVADEC